MKPETVLLATVLVPTLGSLVLPLVGRISEGLRNATALLLVLCALAGSLWLAPSALGGTEVTLSTSWPMGIDFALRADGLAVFMAVVSSLISSIIVLYSFDYISHYENRNEYYCMVVLFLGSMIGLVYSSNLVFLYVFWEITAIVSWRLIGFFRARTDVIRADKAFLVTVFGAVLMLIAFVAIYVDTGSFNLADISKAYALHPASNFVVALIMVGILAKSSTLPFHTWLPDAGVAPSPVTGLLHAAVLVKIGVYVFARLFLASFPFEPVWHTIVPIIAAVSALVSAGAALIDTDLKRIIAYSTISQIGFIFLGLSIGGEFAAAGGLLYILMHGLAKAGLFLCAGIVEQNARTKDIMKMGGLANKMPLTALAFLLCSLSVMGIPPFGGFFSKYMVISGTFIGGHNLIGFTFLAGAILTVLYLLRAFNRVFLGEEHGSSEHEKSWVMVTCVLLLAALSLLGGIFVGIPNEALAKTVGQFVAGIY